VGYFLVKMNLFVDDLIPSYCNDCHEYGLLPAKVRHHKDSAECYYRVPDYLKPGRHRWDILYNTKDDGYKMMKNSVRGIFLLVIKDNCILMSRERPEKRWGLVGGKPNPEETLEEALLREVKEETGVNIISIVSIENPNLRPVSYKSKEKIGGISYIAYVVPLTRYSPEWPVTIGKLEWFPLSKLSACVSVVEPWVFRVLRDVYVDCSCGGDCHCRLDAYPPCRMDWNNMYTFLSQRHNMAHHADYTCINQLELADYQCVITTSNFPSYVNLYTKCNGEVTQTLIEWISWTGKYVIDDVESHDALSVTQIPDQHKYIQVHPLAKG